MKKEAIAFLLNFYRIAAVQQIKAFLWQFQAFFHFLWSIPSFKSWSFARASNLWTLEWQPIFHIFPMFFIICYNFSIIKAQRSAQIWHPNYVHTNSTTSYDWLANCVSQLLVSSSVSHSNWSRQANWCLHVYRSTSGPEGYNFQCQGEILIKVLNQQKHLSLIATNESHRNL